MLPEDIITSPMRLKRHGRLADDPLSNALGSQLIDSPDAAEDSMICFRSRVLIRETKGAPMAAETKSGTVLDRIIEARRAAIAHRKKSVPETALRFGVKHGQPVRDFPAALTRDSLNVIAELKKASPSRGLSRADFDPVALAKGFEAAGAAALSVLTEEEFFQGDLKYMRDARKAVGVPVLRKDFIYRRPVAGLGSAGDRCRFVPADCCGAQRWPSRRLACAWTRTGYGAFGGSTYARGADAGFLAAGARIIGVNNRDLRTLEVRVETYRWN